MVPKYPYLFRTILLSTTPSKYEYLNIHQNMHIATLLSMVSVTLPNISFWAFNSLSAETPRFTVTATGVMFDVDVDVDEYTVQDF